MHLKSVYFFQFLGMQMLMETSLELKSCPLNLKACNILQRWCNSLQDWLSSQV